MINKALPKVLHISFARKYDYSLLLTWQKRLSLAADISTDYVVQGVRERKFRSLHEVAQAYYIPQWFPRYFQYVVDCLIAFGAVIYFGLRKGVVIVISHDPYVAIPVLLAKWVLKAFGRSIVVVVEALGDWREVPFLHGLLPRWLKGPFSKVGDFAFKHADVTRANSLFTASKIRSITDNPCIILPPYVELSLFLADAEQVARPQDSQVILYAGVLAFGKGVHVLVQAFAQLAPRHPGATLLIIGKGAYEEEIERVIQVSGVSDRIKLHAFMTQKELKRHIDSCAMVVLPSFSEGLGRILLEAMACGRPVIVSDLAAVKELIRDGWNGLLAKPGDAQALAEQMEKLLQMPELANTLAANGKRLVQERYSEAAFIAGYRSLIEAAIQPLPSKVREPFLREGGSLC